VPKRSADFGEYFHERAGRFSAFYSSEKVARLLGRGPLFDRLRMTVALVDELGARKVLDVGCGSGPLFQPLAERGISVVGLDPAPSMVARARQAAEACAGLVTVQQRPWEEIDEAGSYDVAVALGVFDYVDDAAELLRRLGTAANRVIGSFPSPGMRLRLRQARYGRRGVGVHGYRKGDLDALARSCGLALRDAMPLGSAGHLAHFGPAGGSGSPARPS
jgi:SAM-dependent methyltransferase